MTEPKRLHGANDLGRVRRRNVVHGLDERLLVALLATHTRDTGPLEQVILVHGEPGPQKVLKEKLAARGITKVSNPKPTDTIEI